MLLNRFLPPLMIGLLTSIGIFAVTSQYFKVTSLYRMAYYGKTAPGWITEKEPENHYLVAYSFKVDGQIYTGEGGVGLNNFAQVKVGDQLNVIYDPYDPSNSCLRNAYSKFRDMALILAAFSLIAGITSGIMAKLIQCIYQAQNTR
jgi:hypothetical protein